MSTKRMKGKKWLTVVAPPYFDSVEIAKTPVSEPEMAVGRRLVVNAVDLTDDMSKFFMKIILRITRVDGEKAFTEFDSFEILRDYLARMIVRRTRRIDIIEDYVTKDNVPLRVKIVMTTSRGAKTTIEKRLRSKIKEVVEDIVKNSTLEEFLKKVISGEAKSKCILEGRKIYPIRNFEFRKIERLWEKGEFS